MVDFWLIVAFLGGCVASLVLLYGFNWAVEKRTTSVLNSKYAKMGNEKKETTKTETAAMMLELKGVLDGDGDLVKEKLPKVITLATQYPNATEALFKQLRGFI